MPDLSNPKPSRLRRIAWATGVLCVACCAAPFVGVAMGSATLAAFAFYAEGAAIAGAVLGVALLVYKLISRRKAPSCDIDSGYRPKLETSGQPKKH